MSIDSLPEFIAARVTIECIKYKPEFEQLAYIKSHVDWAVKICGHNRLLLTWFLMYFNKKPVKLIAPMVRENT